MTIQQPIGAAQLNILPETAPFSKEQRAWLNGFFAGMLSLDVQAAAAACRCCSRPRRFGPTSDDGDAPWHDASMPIAERMKLAEGRPRAQAVRGHGAAGLRPVRLPVRDLLGGHGRKARSSELNLCVPGGKETSRMLKRSGSCDPLLPLRLASRDCRCAGCQTRLAAAGYSARRRLLRRSVVRRRSAAAGRRRTRVTSCSTSRSPASPTCRVTASACMPKNDPALADAVLAAMRAPADFPERVRAARSRSATALIEDYALGAAPDMLFELMGYIVGGERRKKAKALAKGQDPDGDAATSTCWRCWRRSARCIPIRKRSSSAWSRCSRGFTPSPPRRSRRPARCI